MPPQHILQQEWPEFLNLLDSSPGRAAEEFYTFARTLLSVAPPRNLWEVPEDSRDDLIHDLVLACCSNDFAILRRYQSRGHAFAGWFALVARNRIADAMRRERRQEKGRAEEEAMAPLAAAESSPAQRALSRVALEKVVAQIEGLGDICKLLLLGAAEGCKPRELVHLVGWPQDWNKKASDDLRVCRRKLRKRLEDAGLDLSELLA